MRLPWSSCIVDYEWSVQIPHHELVWYVADLAAYCTLVATAYLIVLITVIDIVVKWKYSLTMLSRISVSSGTERRPEVFWSHDFRLVWVKLHWKFFWVIYEP